MNENLIWIPVTDTKLINYLAKRGFERIGMSYHIHPTNLVYLYQNTDEIQMIIRYFLTTYRR